MIEQNNRVDDFNKLWDIRSVYIKNDDLYNLHDTLFKSLTKITFIIMYETDTMVKDSYKDILTVIKQEILEVKNRIAKLEDTRFLEMIKIE